ncbi:site-specific tyrosine recombinase XerD [Aeromicrobium ponti]|uniref:Integrase/recombinase XerD n=1 Tax=Cytobacillus oceanisediminis TaxID=665099 RepID=A0A562JWD3_9BACI|nr:tyrosine-type recombinase/integrase [Cytobacillus oceanisediminis]TWH87488.1 integrase/recombinase XerD [Cytobacillus oceanisediminis]
MSKKQVKRMYFKKNIGNNSGKVKLNEIPITTLFEYFISDKKIEGLASRTLDDYYTHFSYLMDYLQSELVNTEFKTSIFKGYIAYMLDEKQLNPVTVNVRIRTIRAFLRYCYMQNYIKDPIHEQFKPVKTIEDTLESFTPEEVKKLISVIDDKTYKGFRDKVIIFVLIDTLVRCSELVNIKRKNVDIRSGHITLESIDTKSKKTRVVPISTKTIKLLKEYLSITEDFDSEMLFLTYEGTTLSDNTVRKNLAEYGQIAKINKRVSPHTFRHTGALFYILNGGDPFSLQKILGHTDMSMVRKYIQMTNTDVKKQHNIYSPLNKVFK